MAYISYLDLPKHWGLEKGDRMLLTSDIMQLMFTAVRNGERFDRDAFLDAVLGVIGPEGTLLIIRRPARRERLAVMRCVVPTSAVRSIPSIPLP